MSACRQCGLDHQRLGVEIRGDTLSRTADKSRHMLRTKGGGWAFEAALIIAHPEIDQIVVTDRNTGETWQTDRRTFEIHSYDFTVSGRAQRALGDRHWNTGSNDQPDEHNEPDAGAVQLSLFSGIANGQTRPDPRRRRGR